jgi:hypothetical protein
MHGIRFQSGEDPQDYTKLKAALFAEHKPRGRSQEKLMESVAKALLETQASATTVSRS